MKKLIALGIVVTLLIGLTGLAMAKCVTVNPKTIDLTSEETFKVTVQGTGFEETIDPETVECEGASVVKSQLTGNGKKLMLWFYIQDLVGVEPGDIVELTLTGEYYDGTPFELVCEPIRVISGEEE